MANQTSPVIQVKDSNVGIGTNNPTAKLFIEGNDITLNTEGSAQGKQLYFRYSNGANIQSDSYLYFSTGGSPTEKMRITSDGSLLVGATSQTYNNATYGYVASFKGAVTSQAYISVALSNQSSTSEGMLFGLSSTAGNIYVLDNKPLVLYTNATEKMRITSAGNVGIGTTSPAIVAGYVAETIDGTNGSFTEYRQNGTALFRIGADSSRPFLYGMTNAPMDFYTNTNLWMRITAGGNVGIGTTSPAYKLDIGSNTSETFRISAVATSGSTGNLLFGSNVIVSQAAKIQGIYGGSWDGALAFFTQDAGAVDGNRMTEKVRILSNGNVGIGTTSPSYKLDVNVASNSDALRIQQAGTSKFILTGDGVMTWGSSAANGVLTWDTNIVYIGGLTNNALGLRTNGSEKVRITTGGNVGIGTTNPTEKLDVAGSGKIQGNLFLTAADPYIEGSGSGAMRIKHTAGQVMYIRPDQAGNVVFFEGASGQTVYMATATPSVNSTQNSSSTLIFETRARNAGGTLNIKSTSLQNTVYDIANNLSRFSITGQDVLYLEGNVGIGTTAPGHKLEVDGAANSIVASFDHTSFDGRQVGLPGRFMVGPLGSGYPEIGYNFTTSSSVYTKLVNDTAWGMTFGLSNRMSFRYAGAGTGTFSWSEFMSITNAGNVGIGTTSPQAKLHVSGTISYGSARFSPTSANGESAIAFYDDVAGTSQSTSWVVGQAGWGHTGDFVIGNENGGVGGNVRLLIERSGNVGIGTTSPTEKLHVAGTILSDQGEARFRFNSTSGTGRAYDMIGGNDGKFYFYDRTATSYRYVIDASGNVGIGTTAPSQRLHVAGASIISDNTSINPDSYGSTVVAGGVATAGGWGLSTAIGGNSGVGHSWALGSNGDNFYMGYENGSSANSMQTFLQVDDSTRNLFLVPVSGNVGIGTTSPTEKLHVDGSVVVTYNNSYQGINSVGNKAILARVSPTTGIINYAEYATAANLNGFVMGSDDARVKGNIATDSLEFITNGSTRMTVLSSGNVGVNTTTPGTNFHVVGDVLIQTGALGVGVNPNATDGRIDASNDIVAYSSSDRRLKENITPIANALDKVKSLTGVEFDWKPEHKKAHGYEGHDTGVIAQEVQEVMPTAVRTNDTGYLAVRYEKMIGLLIEAMKEQQTQIDELKAKLDGLTK